jgi:nucleoredoxin
LSVCLSLNDDKTIEANQNTLFFSHPRRLKINAPMPPPPVDRIPLGPILGDAGDVSLRGPDGDQVALPPNLVGNPRAAIAFYVSAHWCPPCRAFTPALASTYPALCRRLSEETAAKRKKDDGDDGKAGEEHGASGAPSSTTSPTPPPFEFIFVSADRTRQAYEDYAASQPWPSLDYGSNRREAALEGLGVAGIPALVVVSGDGRVLTRAGVAAAKKDPAGRAFPWEGHTLPLWRHLPPTVHWLLVFAFMHAVRWLSVWARK